MTDAAASNDRPAARLERVDHAAGPVAYLTLSERRLNLLGSPLLERLAERLEEVRVESAAGAVRALVLRGAGERAFIGGADIEEMAGLDERSARVFITALHRVCERLRELPVPVVAMIDGYCLGAGLEVAASCDLRIATQQAVFGMPEVRVGIPSVIEAALLPRLVGWGRASEMVLTGRLYDAAEALRIGLVEAVVARDALPAAVDQRLADLLAGSAAALAWQKELFRAWQERPLAEAIEAGIDQFALAYRTGEPAERMRAFLDRRRARGAR